MKLLPQHAETVEAEYRFFIKYLIRLGLNPPERVFDISSLANRPSGPVSYNREAELIRFLQSKADLYRIITLWKFGSVRTSEATANPICSICGQRYSNHQFIFCVNQKGDAYLPSKLELRDWFVSLSPYVLRESGFYQFVNQYDEMDWLLFLMGY